MYTGDLAETAGFTKVIYVVLWFVQSCDGDAGQQ